MWSLSERTVRTAIRSSGTRIDEGFSAVVQAHEIDQAKSFTPDLLLIVIGGFAQNCSM